MAGVRTEAAGARLSAGAGDSEAIEQLLAGGWTDQAEARQALQQLASTGIDGDQVAIPDSAYAVERLRWMDVPEDTVQRVLQTRRDLESRPELIWLLQRCRSSLVREMGMVTDGTSMPSLPDSFGTISRYFYVWVFLATVDATLEYHRSLGISVDQSREILSDLSRKFIEHQKMRGHEGFSAQNWMARHFRGLIFQCGRLQFERGFLGPSAADRCDGDANEPVLWVHIPETGPLVDLDASFEGASQFFAQHFPHERYERYLCDTWLLDSNLALILPPTSNIMEFQRRFTPLGICRINDSVVIICIFRKVIPEESVPQAIAALPTTTTLERGIVERLAAGEHWRFCVGWGHLPPLA